MGVECYITKLIMLVFEISVFSVENKCRHIRSKIIQQTIHVLQLAGEMEKDET